MAETASPNVRCRAGRLTGGRRISGSSGETRVGTTYQGCPESIDRWNMRCIVDQGSVELLEKEGVGQEAWRCGVLPVGIDGLAKEM